MHIGHSSVRMAKILILKYKGLIKKIIYESVDDSSLSYRLFLENRWKKELMQQRVNTLPNGTHRQVLREEFIKLNWDSSERCYRGPHFASLLISASRIYIWLMGCNLWTEYSNISEYCYNIWRKTINNKWDKLIKI